MAFETDLEFKQYNRKLYSNNQIELFILDPSDLIAPLIELCTLQSIAGFYKSLADLRLTVCPPCSPLQQQTGRRQ